MLKIESELNNYFKVIYKIFKCNILVKNVCNVKNHSCMAIIWIKFPNNIKMFRKQNKKKMCLFTHFMNEKYEVKKMQTFNDFVGNTVV
jgi:hypothetical protein